MITGFALIFVILITFSYFNKPSQSEIDAAKRQSDSIVQVEAENARQTDLKAKESEAILKAKLSGATTDSTGKSQANSELKSLYGVFSEAVKGTEHFITLENNLMKIKVSNKGGKNAFCETCIALWGKTHKTCPYCRATNLKVFCVNKHVPEPEPIPVPEPVPEPIIIHTSQNKTKLEHIENLFDESKLGSSIIIFSDHSSIFKEISKMLIQKNIRYVELDGGNMDVIEKDLQLFKSGEARVLMTNSSFYGCGMNLENATDVVFLHKTANTMYEQVIGRAQRPVRTCRLNVTELLHENEYIHNNEHI